MTSIPVEQVDSAVLASIPPAKLADAARQQGGDVLVIARLVWDGQAFRWNGEWQLDWKGKHEQWKLSAVTFDEAFRQGLGGAAQILSEQQ